MTATLDRKGAFGVLEDDEGEGYIFGRAWLEDAARIRVLLGTIPISGFCTFIGSCPREKSLVTLN
jgi:hypothetical protein